MLFSVITLIGHAPRKPERDLPRAAVTPKSHFMALCGARLDRNVVLPYK